MRCAVLDLGSTSFQVLVADAFSDGTITPVARERAMLRLGARAFRERPIPADLARDAVTTVRRFAALADSSGADHVVAVATSALREAADRRALTRSLSLAAGAPVRSLTGAEEARLMFGGLAASVTLPPGVVLGIDLGGGSLELAMGDRSGARWTASFGLGTVRLAEELARSDPPTGGDLDRLRHRVGERLRAVRATVHGAEPATCVITGGTVGRLAAIAASEDARWVPSSLNQLPITFEQLARTRERLWGVGTEERRRIPGIENRRASSLHVGAAILEATLDALGIETFIVSGWGLREGVLLEAVGARAVPVDVRSAAVTRLAASWCVRQQEARAATSAASELFDATAHRHGLNRTDGELLGYAALLQRIGGRVSDRGIHKHSAYLIEHAGMRGFDPTEIAMLASIVRFHRGSGPKATYPPFAAMDDATRERVRRITAILRRTNDLVAAGDRAGHDAALGRISA